MSETFTSFPGLGAFVKSGLDQGDVGRVTSIECVRNAGRLMSQVRSGEVWSEARPRVLYYLMIAKEAVAVIDRAIAFLDGQFGGPTEEAEKAEEAEKVEHSTRRRRA